MTFRAILQITLFCAAALSASTTAGGELTPDGNLFIRSSPWEDDAQAAVTLTRASTRGAAIKPNNGATTMRDLCEREARQHRFRPPPLPEGWRRRDLGFLASPSVFAQGPPAGQLPADTGRRDAAIVIRGGAVLRWTRRSATSPARTC